MPNLKLILSSARFDSLGRLIVGFAALVVLVLSFVWQQASVDRLVVELEKAQNENRRLDTAVNALSLEANQLSSLAQVESRAAKELDLIRPSNAQIVQMEFADDPGLPEFALGSLVGEASAETPGGPR